MTIEFDCVKLAHFSALTRCQVYRDLGRQLKKRVASAFKRFAHFIIYSINTRKSDKEISPHENANNFDAAYYLKLYPDIAAANIHPYIHFVRYGKKEGRRGSPFNKRKNVAPFCKFKKTILLVSHDASRTGAPILALNICRELKANYNVVVLLLNEGSIASFFEQTCNAVVNIDRSMLVDTAFAAKIVDDFIRKYHINYAIVNSIEASLILEPLAKFFIPSVLLIHEFARYTRPRNKLVDAFLWAGTTVFPAKIVQQNALNVNTETAIHLTHVLPQGQSEIPSEPNEKNTDFKIETIQSWSTLETHAKPFIVLGAGSIHYRKGVDLFIATAAELKRTYPECNIKMLWVGSGFDPEHDVNYSCYLAEQIECSDLTDCFEFIDELPNLDELYKAVDVFYLASRLDPLPNVAIDAMMLGKPLICFDKATGIAEILEQNTDTAECIMPHLSVTEASKKIVQLYQSPQYYASIANKVKQLALQHFNMKTYVANLVGFFENQTKLSKQEELDCITLHASNDFNEAFFLNIGLDRQDSIRKYVRSWHSKANPLRKPAPGFNPTIYHQHNCHQDIYSEPFAHYLRSGKPKGPWQEKVITPCANFITKKKALRTAIHIHVFYPDILPDILKRIPMKSSVIDVYLSCNESLLSQVTQIVSDFKKINSKISTVPNKGRDLGPFLTTFHTDLQKYDVIGHFHTKKSVNIKNTKAAENWFLFLIENLLGGQHSMAEQILNEFEQDTGLGLVFADDPNIMDWGKNKPFAEELAKSLKLSDLPENYFNFPVGTMFWVRPKAIKPLFDLHYTRDMYPEEPLPYDGSILHAIERLIPIIVANQGFKQAVTHIPGLTR